MDERWWLLQYVFPTAAFAGLAALLRSGEVITWRNFFSATLNSGLFGLAVGLVMVARYGPEHFNLIWGAATLCGLAGIAGLEFAIELFRSWARRQTDKQD